MPTGERESQACGILQLSVFALHSPVPSVSDACFTKKDRSEFRRGPDSLKNTQRCTRYLRRRTADRQQPKSPTSASDAGSGTVVYSNFILSKNASVVPLERPEPIRMLS